VKLHKLLWIKLYESKYTVIQWKILPKLHLVGSLYNISYPVLFCRFFGEEVVAKKKFLHSKTPNHRSQLTNSRFVKIQNLFLIFSLTQTPTTHPIQTFQPTNENHIIIWNQRFDLPLRFNRNENKPHHSLRINPWCPIIDPFLNMQRFIYWTVEYNDHQRAYCG
jgi:hypothetical protein